MSAPLITIGLTTYNAEDTAARAVHSALAQSWRPIEIVAVDDCSTDGTFGILQELAVHHPELRIYRNDVNGGVAVSRNRVLNEAQGEFIAFFDDDDESHSSRVRDQVMRLTEYEGKFAYEAPVICHTARNVIYPDGERRYEPTMGLRINHKAPSGIDVARRILMGTPVEDAYGACPTCSQMARLSTYRALGGFDEAFRRGEDTDFNVRLALAGGHFVGLETPLVEQRMTKTSEKSLDDECRFNLMLLDKNRNVMESEGQYEFCREWILMKCAWLSGHHFAFLSRAARLFMAYPILTLNRFRLATPNRALNKAFSRFHGDIHA